jgi:hypothetical protein
MNKIVEMHPLKGQSLTIIQCAGFMSNREMSILKSGRLMVTMVVSVIGIMYRVQVLGIGIYIITVTIQIPSEHPTPVINTQHITSQATQS